MCETADLVGVSPEPLESLFDIMEALNQLNKDGQAGVSAPVTPGLTTKKEWLMTRLSAKPENTRQAIAVDYLWLTRSHMERAKSLRLHYMQLAREEGLTHQQIGDILGYTEARIRQMLRGE